MPILQIAFQQTELKTKIRTAIGNSDVLDDYKQKSTNFSKEKKGATELVYQKLKITSNYSTISASSRI